MSTGEEMVEFVTLWDLVQDVQLNDQEDNIVWKWTGHGSYTSKSAYLAQLKGFDAKAIWHAHAEGKQKYFGWLLVQSKIMTADKMQERN